MKVFKDVQSLYGALMSEVTKKLNEQVATDVISKFKANIQKDVYDVYTPILYNRRKSLLNNIGHRVDVRGNTAKLLVYSTASPDKSYFDKSYSYATSGSLMKWIEGYSSSDNALDLNKGAGRSKVKSLFGAYESGNNYPWLYRRTPVTDTQRQVMEASYKNRVAKMLTKGGK